MQHCLNRFQVAALHTQLTIQVDFPAPEGPTRACSHKHAPHCFSQNLSHCTRALQQMVCQGWIYLVYLPHSAVHALSKLGLWVPATPWATQMTRQTAPQLLQLPSSIT